MEIAISAVRDKLTIRHQADRGTNNASTSRIMPNSLVIAATIFEEGFRSFS